MIKTSGKQGLTEADLSTIVAVLPAQSANDEKLIQQGIQEGPALVATDRSVG